MFANPVKVMNTMIVRGATYHVKLPTAIVNTDREGMNLLSEIYTERARLLAHLSALHESYFIRDNQDPDWPVVCIELPSGQFSCHISPEDIHLFDHVPFDVSRVWDGHTTEEKWRRLEEHTKELINVRGS